MLKQRNISQGSTRWVIALIDVILILVCFYFAHSIASHDIPYPDSHFSLKGYLLIALLAYLPTVVAFRPTYLDRELRGDIILKHAMQVSALHILLLMAILFILRDFSFQREFLVWYAIFASAAILLCRVATRRFAAKQQKGYANPAPAPYEEPLLWVENRFFKRLVDIVFSGVFLLTVFPVIYVIVAIALKIKSPGPVFIIRERVNWNGSILRIVKFRTTHIRPIADEAGEIIATAPEEFPFGDFLKETNIDKLPQFINVFFGSMSIVGPRHYRKEQAELVSKAVEACEVSIFARPGITGWAKTQGFYGRAMTDDNVGESIKSDLWYIENWSVWLDILTVYKSIFQKQPNIINTTQTDIA